MKCYLYDLSFYGDPTSARGATQNESPIQWIRPPQIDSEAATAVFTDLCFSFVDSVGGGFRKVAWLIEPEVINPVPYQYLIEHYKKFDLVLCHHKKYCKKYGWTYYPFGGTWISPKDRKIYKKTKNISMVFSDKTGTKGHRLRHEIASKLGDRIDLYGTGCNNPIDNKLEALKDYRYTIVVENDVDCPLYWTEKILDPILCGCIPINCRDNGISQVFDPEGILVFKSIDDLSKILDDIELNGQESYKDRLKIIENNYILADNFVCAEKSIYDILTKCK